MHGRNDLPPGMDAAVAAFERWCRVRLLAAFQQAGLLAKPGARISAEDVLALHPGLRAYQPALSAGSRDGAVAGSEGSQALGSLGAGHQRMVAALLETARCRVPGAGSRRRQRRPSIPCCGGCGGCGRARGGGGAGR